MGKLFVTLFLAGLSAAIYAAWKNDGLGWLGRQVGVVQTPSKSRGDVLVAMRDASTDIGWKPEVCEEITRDKAEKALPALQQINQMFGNNNPRVANANANPNPKSVKVFVAGEHLLEGSREHLGIPICKEALLVVQFDDPEAAKKLLDDFLRQPPSEQELFGSRITTTTAAATIPNCDGAARTTTRSVDIRTDNTVARTGRFFLILQCDDTTSTTEQDRRLSAFAKRLNDHFPR